MRRVIDFQARPRGGWEWRIEGSDSLMYTNSHGEGIFILNAKGEKWQDMGFSQFRTHPTDANKALDAVRRHYERGKKKMGAPPIPEEERRVDFIKVYLTRAEKVQFEAWAAEQDTTISTYIRTALTEWAQKKGEGT